jgi:hypothetical protein
MSSISKEMSETSVYLDAYGPAEIGSVLEE